MKGITYQGTKSIRYDNLPDPEIIDSRDVIIRVCASAVCGSDLHVYRGHETGPDAGTVMGHEFSGEIVETGRDVFRFKKDDRVVSPFTTNCGHCYFCQIGLTCRCKNGLLYGWIKDGIGLQGGQAELVRVPLADSTLLKYRDQIAPEMALLAGDVLSTAFYCAQQGEMNPGATIAVIGCGPVGLMTIIAARELGAETIFAIDSVPERLTIAQSYGALPLNLSEQEPSNYLERVTDGIGVDAVLEAVGNPDAAKLAYDIIRPGGIISTVGVHHSRHFPFSPAEAYDKNITYKVGRAPARIYMDRAMKLIEEGNYNFGAIFTHRLKFEEAELAYRLFDQKLDGCIKPIFISQ